MTATSLGARSWLTGASGIAIIVLWILAVRAMTPMRLTLLTGPEGTTSFTDGQPYKSLLEKRGLWIDLVPTAGPYENLQRLIEDDTAQATFIEVGLEKFLDDPATAENLAVTPSFQLLIDPALNPDEDRIWIFGFRARITLWPDTSMD